MLFVKNNWGNTKMSSSMRIVTEENPSCIISGKDFVDYDTVVVSVTAGVEKVAVFLNPDGKKFYFKYLDQEGEVEESSTLNLVVPEGNRKGVTTLVVRLVSDGSRSFGCVNPPPMINQQNPWSVQDADDLVRGYIRELDICTNVCNLCKYCKDDREKCPTRLYVEHKTVPWCHHQPILE